VYSNPPANPLPQLDYRWVALASLLLSAWLVALDPLINRDAIIYLRAADAYMQDGFAASMEQFGRPLLSICMAWLHQLTGIPLVHAGLVIVTLSYALLAVAFVSVVHTLGGDRSVQLIAAAVILSHPMLNSNRSSIMRDSTYWALLLLAFREMLLYLRTPLLKHHLRWLGYILLAYLFRFEGLFFALLTPIAILFTRDLPQRGRHCLRLLLSQLVILAAVLLALSAYQTKVAPDTTLFPIIVYYLKQLVSIPTQFSLIAAEAAQDLLTFTSRRDANIAAVAALGAVLLINICRATTWVWVVTLVYGWRHRLLARFRRDDAQLLWAHVLIALVYLAAFILINRFMLERYSKQLVIFLLLLLPFILSKLYHAGGWRKGLVILLLLGMTIDTLDNGSRDKIFIPEATQWIREHTPDNSRIVTNEKYIAYFSERQANWQGLLHVKFQLEAILAQEKLWRDSDYMVMHIRKRQRDEWNAWLAQNSLRELRSFKAEGEGMVSVVLLSPTPQEHGGTR
jgi:hypothetical protein